MRSPLVGGGVLVLLTAVASSAQTAIERQDVISRAQLWRPTSVATMDLRAGEPGPGAFAPNATVRCDYRDDDLGGRSPKFRCRIPPDDDVKVKFGAANGEVYAEVAATRLLWALGFGADRMYPLRIVCRGCPGTIGEPAGDGERLVDPATIERRVATNPGVPNWHGWSWAELDLVDEGAGGAPRAQRDALKLLAVLLQHTDTKSEQQRLLCLDPAAAADGRCRHPFMMLNDVGLTFGRATLGNVNAVSSMNHREWASAPVWKYSTTCIGNLPRSLTGTLKDPVIGEEGRRFLASLLMQLSDAQLRDLFDVARADHVGSAFSRNVEAGPTGAAKATVGEWVETFKRKRAEIVKRRCGDDDWSSQAPALFTTTPNRWLQSWASPRVTAVMNIVSLLGYTPFYVALAMVLAFTVNIRAGAALLVLIVLTNAITDATKTVVSYPRPDAVDARLAAVPPLRAPIADSSRAATTVSYLPAAARPILARLAAVPAGMAADETYGFPSGHVAVAIAFLGGLVFLFGWRGAWIAALIWIPLMALSRMYLARHFLGDVVGGVAAGVVAVTVVVRALNLQRLGRGTDRRVLLKTVATAAACAALATVASIPPVYEAGRLAGAVVALVLVCHAAPAGYDDASGAVRVSRLAVAAGVTAVVWWATTAMLHASAGEPGAEHAFVVGAVRTAVLMPVPVLLEAAWRSPRGLQS